jgi:Lon protease-like protein
MSRLLPLFPLQLVVFPRTRLPLHIFEDRYKEMVGEAIRDGSDFGIVPAKENGILNVGCTVIVEKVITKYPDGRSDVVTVGQRRFEILFLNEEKPYLRGQVEFFEDEVDEKVPPMFREKALDLYRQLTATGEARVFAEPLLNDTQLSFQLAQAISDLDFQNQMLHTRSERERLELIISYIEQNIPRMKHAARMRGLAPQNGFGHKIVGA